MPPTHLLLTLLTITSVATGTANSAEPERNVPYDTKHERNVLDFWPAPDTDKPVPVFVWFHGGGFRNGDKSQLEKNRSPMLETYRKAGYAVVSCNYPFLYSNASPDDRIHPPWTAVMLRDKAQKLGIPCLALGGGRNNLPKVENGKSWLNLQLEFCQKHLPK